MRPLLDLLLPPRSLDGEEGSWCTAAELEALRAEGQRLEVGALDLQRRGLPLDHLVAWGDYRLAPRCRLALHRWKYQGAWHYAPLLTALLETLADRLPLEPGMAIVPVPLHWSRRWWRGGNQAEALAQACVSPEHPMRHLLRRRWATVSQVQRADRVALVQLDRPFVVQGRVPRSVLLVDDVCTTGSTLACCATALRKAGVERVSALVLLLSRGAMKHAMRQS